MKKWITSFILGWIVGTVGAFFVFELKQVWGWPIMTAGDVLWLLCLYKIFMKRIEKL